MHSNLTHCHPRRKGADNIISLSINLSKAGEMLWCMAQTIAHCLTVII